MSMTSWILEKLILVVFPIFWGLTINFLLRFRNKKGIPNTEPPRFNILFTFVLCHAKAGYRHLIGKDAPKGKSRVPLFTDIPLVFLSLLDFLRKPESAQFGFFSIIHCITGFSACQGENRKFLSIVLRFFKRLKIHKTSCNRQNLRV